MSATSGPSRRLLFISPLLAMPSQHGGCVYPHAILTELHRQGIAIDYAWLGAPLRGGRRWMRDPLAAPYLSTGWVRGTIKLGSMRVCATAGGWLGKPEKLPYDKSLHGGEHLATPGERRFVTVLIRGLQPTNVLIDSTPMLTLLDDLSSSERSRLHVGVLTHNLTFRRAELYRSHGQPLDFLPMTREEETALLARADTIVAIQEREAEAFRDMLPAKTVVTMPMPLRADPQPPAAAIPGRCLFVGGYSGHNIEAIKWLVSEVWPHVVATCPTAELVVAGTVGRAVPAGVRSVRALGPVDDLKGEYAKAALCLVPLPLGTGLKIKLVEAMSYGRPVITTPAGAEGFDEVEQGRISAVADGPGAFADAVIALLKSPARGEALVSAQLAWLSERLSAPRAVADYVASLR